MRGVKVPWIISVTANGTFKSGALDFAKRRRGKILRFAQGDRSNGKKHGRPEDQEDHA